MKKSLIALVIVIAILIISISSVFAAGCGNWTIYSYDSAYCHSNACYKVVWWQGSWGQTVYEKRQCVRDDNTTYWEYRSYTKWNGCCSL